MCMCVGESTDERGHNKHGNVLMLENQKETQVTPWVSLHNVNNQQYYLLNFVMLSELPCKLR